MYSLFSRLNQVEKLFKYFVFVDFRCRYLVETISPWIAVYEAILTVFIISNFIQATIQDPGKIPRGKWPAMFDRKTICLSRKIYTELYVY